jgi:serine/threonine protein phosphatase 1
MRVLAIGDIHGCYLALSTLLKAVQLTPEDTLITLGDYVNRGPDTHSVVDWLIHRQQTGGLIPLRGNHELMMIAARQDEEAFSNWMAVGGKETLMSYSPGDEPGRLSDVPGSHWEFLENHLQDSYETDRHFFVHANAYPEVPLAEQPDFMLFWEHIDEWTPPHASGKTMICGHTSQSAGLPLNLGHAICIDTAACKGGWLTCLEPETGYYWQANETGQTPEAFLDPPG